MNKFIVVLGILYSGYCMAQSRSTQDTVQLQNIYATALGAGQSYNYVDQLSHQIGSRLSGSLQEKKAIQWIEQTLKSIGMSTEKQTVTVPKWTRGVPEFAFIESQAGTTTNVPICALVGSVATPIGGIKAEIVHVTSIAGLRKLGSAEITGKIVFFNPLMDATYMDTFDAYEAIASIYRDGAKEAAKFGAVGVLVRSPNLALDDYPHTAVVSYGTIASEDKIPVAAISTNGADLLSGMLSLDSKTRFFFNMNCKNWNPVASFNVIAEWKGSTFPNSYLTVAATIDSWDMGEGAQSDSAALSQAIESIRLLKTIGYTPNHSIRIVLLSDGIQSQKGFKAYEQSMITQKEQQQLLFVYNDTGGFTPRGLHSIANDTFKKEFQAWLPPLKTYGITEFNTKKSRFRFRDACPVIALKTDPQRYFEICRSALDTFDRVNKREVALGAAAMASILYIADQEIAK